MSLEMKKYFMKIISWRINKNLSEIKITRSLGGIQDQIAPKF
jgi:hypothetical protein